MVDHPPCTRSRAQVNIPVNNPPKLVGVLVGMVVVGVLMAVNTLTQEVGAPMLTLLIGYLVGNGVAAKRDEPVQPILGRHHEIEQPPSKGT